MKRHLPREGVVLYGEQLKRRDPLIADKADLRHSGHDTRIGRISPIHVQ